MLLIETHCIKTTKNYITEGINSVNFFNKHNIKTATPLEF